MLAEAAAAAAAAAAASTSGASRIFGMLVAITPETAILMSAAAQKRVAHPRVASGDEASGLRRIDSVVTKDETARTIAVQMMLFVSLCSRRLQRRVHWCWKLLSILPAVADPSHNGGAAAPRLSTRQKHDTHSDPHPRSALAPTHRGLFMNMPPPAIIMSALPKRSRCSSQSSDAGRWYANILLSAHDALS